MAFQFEKIDKMTSKGRIQAAEKLLSNEFLVNPSLPIAKRLISLHNKSGKNLKGASEARFNLVKKIEKLEKSIKENSVEDFLSNYDSLYINFIGKQAPVVHNMFASVNQLPMWINYLISLRSPKEKTIILPPEHQIEMFKRQVNELFVKSFNDISFVEIEQLMDCTAQSKYLIDLSEKLQGLWQLPALMSKVSLFASDLKKAKTFFAASKKNYDNREKSVFNKFSNSIENAFGFWDNFADCKLSESFDVLYACNPFFLLKVSPLCQAQEIHRNFPRALKENKFNVKELIKVRSVLLTETGFNHARLLYFGT